MTVKAPIDKEFTCELRRTVNGKLQYKYVTVEAPDKAHARKAVDPHAVGLWWVALILEKKA